MTRGLPSGTVTLVLGDVESSTERWEASADEMAAAMTALHALLDDLIAAHDGARPLEQGEGDSFVAAFGRAADAVSFARALQDGSPLPLRLGIHTGDVDLIEGGYAGTTIIRAARIRDAGHGGQVLLSHVAAQLVVDNEELDDLGEHHLKGLARPERVWQLPGEFPSLRLTDAPAAPHRMTTFVGRQLEVAHVRGLAKNPGCVTITGAGGAGKTRLALELLGAGTGWFVDLAAVDRDEIVAVTIADIVGARARPTQDRVDAVAATIGDRDALLVLDNCEHLLARCSEITSALLSQCANLTVVATSREPLGLDGEVTYRLPSLPEGEARELFVERARRANPRFVLDDTNVAAVDEICARLDGMPLAIELAAARMRVFSAAQLLEALHDRFRLLTGGARTALPRQRTLEASVDWSYAMLLEPERVLLRRLSVFAGGFTTEAAVAVGADAALEAHHVFDLIVTLVEKSLITPDEETPGRFHMLETIRHFAGARLMDEREVDAVRRRHYECFRRVAHHRRDQTETAWRAQVRLDEANIRRALQWASDQLDFEPLFELTQELTLYWSGSRRALEGLGWLTEVEKRTQNAPPQIRARVLRDLSVLTNSTGDMVGAGVLAHAAFDLAHEVGDDELILRCALYCHPVFGNAGTTPPGFYEEAIAIAQRGNDPRPLAVLTAYRGFHVMREEGDVGRAKPILIDAAAMLHAAGITRLAAMAEAWIAMGLVLVGELTESIEWSASAAEQLRGLGDTFALSNLLAFDAVARAATGNLEGADRVLAELDALAEEGGDAWVSLNRGFGHGLVCMTRDQWSTAVDHLRPYAEVTGSSVLTNAFASILAVALAMDGRFDEAEAIVTGLPEVDASVGGVAVGNRALVLAVVSSERGDEAKAWEFAYDAWVKAPTLPLFGPLLITVLARGAARLGRWEEAARLAGLAEKLLAAVSVGGRTYLDEAAALCRSVLGDARFDQLAAEGASMTSEEALALVQRGRGSRQRPMLGWNSLTPTEAQVAALVAQGTSNKSAAAQLFMSEATVKTHLTRIYSKVGVKNRAQLAASHRHSKETPTAPS